MKNPVSIISPFLFSTIFILLIVACQEKPQEVVLDIYQPKHEHEAYIIGLKEAGLAKTTLGEKWINAADKSLTAPIQINSPFEEIFYIPDNQPTAFGYKLAINKGQRADVYIEQLAGDSMKIFLDAYSTSNDTTLITTLIASADSTHKKLSFEVMEDGDYIIRVQTELLGKGQFKLKIVTAPSILFPVAGKGKTAIGSLFGVPRDAGKRVHEGIDIFARRHTPIVAPCDGNINWAGVREGSLGGKVIWMRDTIRNMTLYFAHLEDVFAQKDQNVYSGDTIGTVGNSGNAITTHPHLHFGIYQNGAIDPYHHVVPTRTKPSKMLAKESFVGKLARARKACSLRIGSIKSKKRLPLNRYQLLDVIGITASYYHVALPNKTEGFIFYDDIETLDRAIKSKKQLEPFYLLEPDPQAITIEYSAPIESVKVLAVNQEYLFIETEEDAFGWIHQSL